METFKIEIELPQELLIGLNIPPAEITQKVREWLVLELFREEQISAGKAAELLNLTKGQFIDLLNLQNIPYLDLSPGELAQDVVVAIAAVKHSKGK